MSGIVTIVQARTGSTRLPGKVLLDLGGRPVLARVLERVERTGYGGQTVVATSSLPRDDAIATLCGHLGVPCFRGSELDVLDRYYHCALAFGADTVVRVTADCPLLAWELTNLTVQTFRERSPDYAEIARLPAGTSAEVVSMEALARAWRQATDADDRQHVLTYVAGRPEQFDVWLPPPPDPALERPALRLTLDTPDDYRLISGIYDRLGERIHQAPLAELIELVDNDPEFSVSGAEAG